ncbi:MAG: hypothetical protein J6W96_00120 [Alphaproteobacteria bacterium]|nr:hypothetical protein [Alphaproteobacteria bacterium]
MLSSIILGIWLLYTAPTYAEPLFLSDLYTNPTNQQLPEAIILYNSENSCENCNKAINIVIDFLKNNYRHQLHAYLIDTAKNPQFASAFNAYGPLTLVIVRISDHAAFGYEKLAGIQSLIGNKKDFNRRLSEFINNFLD